MKNAFLALVLLIPAIPARAQELDVFDANDFIDPRERGAVFRPGGLGVDEGGRTFSIARAYGGRVSDYQWRTTTTDGDLSFLHIAWSRYWNDSQLNVKVTTFHSDTDADIPTYRGTFQFGRYYGEYFRASRRGGEQAEEQRIAARLLFTWSVEDNPYRDSTTSTRRDALNHEFGMQADVRIPTPHGRKLDGAFIWMRRRIDEGRYVDRVSYLYRVAERHRSNGRLRLNASLGMGTERTDTWHCCLARAVLSATFVIPRFDTGINIAYAPTYSPGNRERKTHSELAVYLDRTIFAHLANIIGAK